MKCDNYRYLFMENDIELKAEAHHLIDLAKGVREAEHLGVEFGTTITDLIFQIEYEFDIDGIRSEDEEWED